MDDAANRDAEVPDDTADEPAEVPVDEVLIDSREVRRQLKCSLKIVTGLARRGVLKPIRLGHRTVRYRLSDLQRLKRGESA